MFLAVTFIPAFTTKAMRHGTYIWQLVKFARYCTSICIFILKIFKLLQDYWHRVTDIMSLEIHFESSSGHTLIFCPNLVKYLSRICFQMDLLPRLLRWSSRQHKDCKGAVNFVSSGSKIIKRLRRRKCEPMIIERIMGLALAPSTALYRSSLGHYTLNNKVVGTIWSDASKPPKRRRIFVTFVSRYSLSPWTRTRVQTIGTYPALANVFIYFWYFFLSPYLFV